MTGRPIIAITMGDAGGIGPEIIVKALVRPEVEAACRSLVVGSARVMEHAVQLVGASLRVQRVASARDAGFESGVMEVIDLDNVDPDQIVFGKAAAMTGRAAYESIAKAVELCLAGDAQAVATSPLNKEGLHLAGINYPGHTEILAALTNTKDYCMLLVSESLKVSHVSTHVSLRQACDLATRARVRKVIDLTNEALIRMGIDKPRLAVAGLNPHAGEGGLFGCEEQNEIGPAIQDAVAAGLTVRGPMPPDSVYFRAMKGEFDAVVAMYHDQGHIPLKAVGFDQGVNVSLGLPILRTSVDHGTAYGKAGKGTANPRSMVEAILLAARMSAAPSHVDR
jgi:4-phospho-D-threonate 3-dehydrogenase / 4-phospho-D-erythronate 3-dehydrogenase